MATEFSRYHARTLSWPTWNSSEFARSFGVANTTVRNYLDVLSAALVVRQLPAWFENLAKRQVKTPKVYVLDSGILHTLLGINSQDDLEVHPKIGASWESYVLEQAKRCVGARNDDECHYWRTHAGAELDLLLVRGRLRVGVEIKRTSSPQLTPSMRSALTELKLRQFYVIHAGEDTFPLGPRVHAVAFSRLLEDVPPLSRERRQE